MNQTAFCTAYQDVGLTWMIGVAVLTTYWSEVPSIGASFTSPSNFGGSIFASSIFTSAVCGIALAISASFACGVPATAAFTFSFGLSSGIFAKSGGSASLATYSHGPSLDAAPEPAAGDEHVELLVARVAEHVAGRVLDVLELRARRSGRSFGSPSVTISSVGFVATTIAGTLPDLSVGSVFASFGLPPGRKSTWPEAFASAIAFSRSVGSFFTTSHAPSSASASASRRRP